MCVYTYMYVCMYVYMFVYFLEAFPAQLKQDTGFYFVWTKIIKQKLHFSVVKTKRFT